MGRYIVPMAYSSSKFTMIQLFLAITRFHISFNFRLKLGIFTILNNAILQAHKHL